MEQKKKLLNPFKSMKSYDIFTKDVKFNINGQNEHKTVIGGIVSAILKFLYFCYFIALIQKMWFFKEDRTFSTIGDIQHDLSVQMFNTDIKSYYNLMFYTGEEVKQLWYNDETRRYIHIQFAEQSSNYTMEIGESGNGEYF